MTALRSPHFHELGLYIQDIAPAAPLTRIEEKELAHRIGKGDRTARDVLVRANLRLVVSVAHAFRGRGLDLADLVEEGNLGLMRAAELFKPGKGVRFSTYAVYWIRQAIQRGLCNTASSVRLPRKMTELLARFRHVQRRLEESEGHTPTSHEVMDGLGLTARQKTGFKKALLVHQSHEQFRCARFERNPVDILNDDRAPSPHERVAQEEERRAVFDAIEQLAPRSATILRLRFGLAEQEAMTLAEVSEVMGMPRERVRRMEKTALRQMKRLLGA